MKEISMNKIDVKKEAKKLVQDFDSDPDGFSEYDVERSAESLADFWIEYQFARTDIECDWTDKKCHRMNSQMFKELKALGIP